MPSDFPFIGSFAGGGFFAEFDYQNQCVGEFIHPRRVRLLAGPLPDRRHPLRLHPRFLPPRRFRGRLAKLVADLNQYLNSTGRPNAALFIEHLADNRFAAIGDTNGIGAAGRWFDPFMFKHFAYGRNGNIDAEILRVLNASLDFALGKGPVSYVQNHDHSS